MNNIALSSILVPKDGEYIPICPFPIGFIYMSLDPTSPGELYGGN